MWQENQDNREPNPDQAAVLVDVPDDESLLSGKLIRDRGYVEKMPVMSRYWFGKDGILTMDILPWHLGSVYHELLAIKPICHGILLQYIRFPITFCL